MILAADDEKFDAKGAVMSLDVLILCADMSSMKLLDSTCYELL